MRVGLVIEQFDTRRGGLEQWCFQFAVQLLRRGHTVHVVSQRFCPSVRRLPLVRHVIPYGHSRFAFPTMAEACLRTLDLDVIHDMGAGWYCDVFHPHGGSRRSATERSLYLHPAWMRPFKTWLQDWLPRYRQFDVLNARQYVNDGRLILALSHSVVADFAHYHGVPGSQVRLVYNGVDPDRFSPEHRDVYRRSMRARLGVEDQTLVLLMVAHNLRLKGVPAVLRAARRLMVRGADFRLVIVGGKRLGSYLRWAREAGVADVVRFAGTVEDTVPWYSAADVFVHPTWYDPCSLVALEALACGLPVITTQFNGASELMTPGSEGWALEDPADVEGIVQCVESLRDRDLREAMGQAARRLALQHPFSRNVDEVLNVYGEVAGRRRAGSAERMAVLDMPAEPHPTLPTQALI